ncbi:TVP38/TMEM64 family protein [Alkalihalobacterium alkalinitrilicum]|uniref:TVP38/TMEM64 family protein n=1 Tax=Alkalihalobacterium alkalinitrilicum TaxID=427920 RepID=UPI00099562E0|nr:VTT domain-containing protein [Alkalihalobacterium alkalinitrilicum]
MEQSLDSIQFVIEESGWLAPLFFILLHVLRQIFFIPVILVCLLGGYLFGVFYGTIYSLVGLIFTSLAFYIIAKKFPKVTTKLFYLKKKYFGSYHRMSLVQMMIIRLMPFIHFHLISLYLLEISKNVREYTKYSFYACIPPAFVFTAFGHMIHELPLVLSLTLVGLLFIAFTFIGKKEVTYKWSDFFTAKS